MEFPNVADVLSPLQMEELLAHGFKITTRAGSTAAFRGGRLRFVEAAWSIEAVQLERLLSRILVAF